MSDHHRRLNDTNPEIDWDWLPFIHKYPPPPRCMKSDPSGTQLSVSTCSQGALGRLVPESAYEITSTDCTGNTVY